MLHSTHFGMSLANHVALHVFRTGSADELCQKDSSHRPHFRPSSAKWHVGTSQLQDDLRQADEVALHALRDELCEAALVSLPSFRPLSAK